MGIGIHIQYTHKKLTVAYVDCVTWFNIWGARIGSTFQGNLEEWCIKFLFSLCTTCKRRRKKMWCLACSIVVSWQVSKVLTEAGTYPQLPTHTNFFLSIPNSYRDLIWSSWVASRRKIKIWMWGKKVQFIIEKVDLWAFLAWKRNFH